MIVYRKAFMGLHLLFRQGRGNGTCLRSRRDSSTDVHV